ncbi:MAG: hypothetical protein R3B09_35200 [Nannocystaceae bacterium]
MHRIVVTNQVGEKLSDVDVDPVDTVEYVAACISLMPTACVYIDGHLLDDNAKAAVLRALAEAEAKAKGDAAVDGVASASSPAAEARPAGGGSSSSATETIASSTPPPIPDPEQVASYLDTLNRAFEDVRRAQLQNLRDLQDCARRYSEMWMERERQFADEAARQRELTSKSLADVDLLRRCAKTTVLMEDLREVQAERAAETRRLPAGPPPAPAQRGGLGFMDLVHGFLSLTKQ